MKVIAFILFVISSNVVGAAGNQARGKSLFRECAACHSDVAGRHAVGPSLNGVFGRRAGSTEGFRYSPVMKRSGILWTDKNLDAFLEDPQKFIKGNRMPYSGMPNSRDRGDLISYLKLIK